MIREWVERFARKEHENISDNTLRPQITRVSACGNLLQKVAQTKRGVVHRLQVRFGSHSHRTLRCRVQLDYL